MPTPHTIDPARPRQTARAVSGELAIESVAEGSSILEIATGVRWTAGPQKEGGLLLVATKVVTELPAAEYRLEEKPDPFDSLVGKEVEVEFVAPSPKGYRDGKVYFVAHQHSMVQLRQGQKAKWINLEQIKSLG